MFMLVVLKVPAIFMIYLLYWAARNEPENGLVEEDEEGGGGRKPRPLLPRGPRRGPHGGGARPIPRRSRSAGSLPRPRIPAGARQPEPARARERESARALESDRSF